MQKINLCLRVGDVMLVGPVTVVDIRDTDTKSDILQFVFCSKCSSYSALPQKILVHGYFLPPL